MPLARFFSAPFSRAQARAAGYATALLAIAIAALGGLALIRALGAEAPVYQVAFPVLSTLGEGDPVVENGVAVGQVERIALSPDGRAVATLRLFHDRALPGDTRFYNLSHSLMGARKVWMVRGSSAGHEPPLSLREVHEGIFVPGLPETLHKVGELTALVARLRATADSLLIPRDPSRGGSAGGAPALRPLLRLEAARAALARIDSVLRDGEGAVREGVEGLARAAQAGEELAAGLRHAGPEAEAAASRARALLGLYDRAQKPLGEAMASLERLSARAVDTGAAGGPAARVLQSDRDYKTLVSTLETLDSLTTILRTGGLGDDMKIKPRLGKPRQ